MIIPGTPDGFTMQLHENTTVFLSIYSISGKTERSTITLSVCVQTEQ